MNLYDVKQLSHDISKILIKYNLKYPGLNNSGLNILVHDCANLFANRNNNTNISDHLNQYSTYNIQHAYIGNKLGNCI